MPTNRTLLNPIGFGRNGLRVANTPIRLLPPNLGGRTVGLHESTSEKPQSSHKCENPSIPRRASGMLYFSSNTIRVRIGLSSRLCLGIPNLSVCPFRAYAITLNSIIQANSDNKSTKNVPITQVFCIFLRKNLVMSKKSSTFAPAFRSNPLNWGPRKILIFGESVAQNVALYKRRARSRASSSASEVP